MDAYGWLDEFPTVAITLIPFLLTWATALLWRRSRSRWALAALAGALLTAAGIVDFWHGFYVHYSSGAVMHAQNENPDFARQTRIKLEWSIGGLIAALALVGYARTRGTHEQG